MWYRGWVGGGSDLSSIRRRTRTAILLDARPVECDDVWMIAYVCQGMDFEKEVIVLSSALVYALLEPFGSTFLSSKSCFVHLCHAAFTQFSSEDDLLWIYLARLGLNFFQSLME